MIFLLTGQPGSGKTALCVDMLAHDDQFKNRPLFVGGIPELKIEHEPVPPVAEWTEQRNSPEDESIKLSYFTFPANAVIVVDEAQRIYRPRSTGSKVPPEVAAFETHRHTGVDFILLTQHPGLLDANIRKLVGKHIHIAVTPMGRFKYEWTKCADPESKTERDIAARDRYHLPKRAFDLYKSSELHTKIKVKMPFYVYLLGICVLAIGILGWYMYGRIFHREEAQLAQKIDSAQAPKPAGPLTVKDYLSREVPRVPGLYHTAPKYDEVTKVTDAPYPVGCVLIAKWRDRPERCRCTDQQGNDYIAPEGLCRQIVAHGMFKDWGQKEIKGAASSTEAPPTAGRSRPHDAPSQELSLPTAIIEKVT